MKVQAMPQNTDKDYSSSWNTWKLNSFHTPDIRSTKNINHRFYQHCRRYVHLLACSATHFCSEFKELKALLASHTVHRLVCVAGIVLSFIKLCSVRAYYCRFTRDKWTSTASTARYTELPPSGCYTKPLGVISLTSLFSQEKRSFKSQT